MGVREADGSLRCGYDVMAACDLPKVDAWVRFPLPALPFEHEKHSLVVATGHILVTAVLKKLC